MLEERFLASAPNVTGRDHQPQDKGRDQDSVCPATMLTERGVPRKAPAAGGGAMHENEVLRPACARGSGCQSGAEPSDQLAAARRTLRLVHRVLPHISATARLRLTATAACSRSSPRRP